MHHHEKVIHSSLKFCILLFSGYLIKWYFFFLVSLKTLSSVLENKLHSWDNEWGRTATLNWSYITRQLLHIHLRRIWFKLFKTITNKVNISNTEVLLMWPYKILLLKWYRRKGKTWENCLFKSSYHKRHHWKK